MFSSILGRTFLQFISISVILFLSVLTKCQRLVLYPSLWGEDTKIYIRDVLDLGWRSLTIPANGYHTLYSRLVAGFLCFLPLEYAEILFHLGSAVALAFTFFVIWTCLPVDSKMARVVACMALVWIPADTLEIYFTLVNTNWPLSVALAVLVTSQTVTGSRFKHAWLPAIFVLTLSGPESIILAPIVAIRAIIYQDLRKSLAFYAVFSLGACLQLYTILTNSLPRLGASTDTSAADWLEGLVNRTLLGFFSGPILLVLTAALLLWFLYADVRKLSARTQFQIGALPVVGGLTLAAGFYAVRDIPALVGPYALHVRYFVIPFAMALFLILSIARDRLRVVGIGLVIAICAAGYRPYYHDDFGGPPDDQMAAGASRAPTYLALYLKTSRYIPSVKFFGRPGHEAFTLMLPKTKIMEPPVAIQISAASVKDGGFEIPEACSRYQNLALQMSYRAADNAIFQFNTENRSAWHTQYHAVDPGLGETVFAVPIQHSPAVQLTASHVDVQSARLLCF